MRLSLIGMSGSGKSHWSAMLADHGFRRYCCDDLITEKLSHELRRTDETVLALGEWMGFPFEPGYREREAKYLAVEKEVVSGVLDLLDGPAGEGLPDDAVVDTTGSIIYTGKALTRRLKRLTTIVHFSSPPEAREEMFREYLARPRPVLWHGLFGPLGGESESEALARCYRLLLESREHLYRNLAEVEIDYPTRRKPGFGVPEFLALVGAKR